MSTRCSIIYDDEKHIYWECNEDEINFIFYALNSLDYSDKFKNKYGEPAITREELIKIFAYMMEFESFREQASLSGIKRAIDFTTKDI